MCGIVAFVGKKKPNFLALKFMTVAQRDRGKDGVGFVYNLGRHTGHYNIYQDDKSDPLQYFSNIYFPKLTEAEKQFKSFTSIIHNRARSKGTVTKEQIHPWVYEIDGVTHYFAHNGTLENETDLEKEYGLETEKFLTDSHLLGHIISHFGFDVLTKYKGSAAFVYLRSDEPNTLYVWKGASRQATDNIETERPMHFHATKEGVYFASTVSALQCAFDINTDEVYTIDDNHLTIFNYENKKDLIVTKHEYDRSHIPKKEYNNYYGYNSNRGEVKVTKTTFTKVDEFPFNRDTFEDSPQKWAGNKIYYHRGRYYKNGHLVSTEVEGRYITSDGIVLDKEMPDSILVFFHHGLWIKDPKSMSDIKQKYPSRKDVKENLHQICLHYIHPNHIIFFYSEHNNMFLYQKNMATNYLISTSFIPLSYYTYKLNPVGNKYACFEKADKRPQPMVVENYNSKTYLPEDIRKYNTGSESKYSAQDFLWG